MKHVEALESNIPVADILQVFPVDYANKRLEEGGTIDCFSWQNVFKTDVLFPLDRHESLALENRSLLHENAQLKNELLYLHRFLNMSGGKRRRDVRW